MTHMGSFLRERLPFPLLIGLRYLRARRRERFISLITWIALGGVFLGVTTLNLVLGIMTGFEEDLRDRILGFQAHVVVQAKEGPVADPDAVLAVVRSTPGVSGAAPVVTGQVMLTTPAGVTGAQVRGIDEQARNVWPLAEQIKGGEFGDLFQPRPVLSDVEPRRQVMLPAIFLGHELTRQLGVVVGDPVSVVSPLATPSAVGLVPRVRRFAVAGWFESGMAEYDAALVYMNLRDAQRFFDLGQGVSAIEVRATSLDHARSVRDRLRQRLGAGYEVRDWMDNNRTLFAAMQMEKTVYFLVLLLIVLVAAFNIVAMLVLTVLEKRRDIAVLKSLGATAADVAGIFHYKGLVIGIAGTLAGSLIALLLGGALQHYPIVPLPENVFYVDRLPVRMHWSHFSVVAAASLAICFLATIYPARRAARVVPVEVLRSE
ncbi:MAG: lipoprotein-releasing ABC transporter permease subunit [Candidatus Binatia bacterium]|nr:lipoprotein-releasing ABC transporter permease subunit [Candidatus Binatia bacterium]